VVRSLSEAAEAEKAKTASTPVNLVRLAVPGNTLLLSDRDITVGEEEFVGKILSWGALNYSMQEDGHSSTSMTLTLADPDRTLLASLKSAQWQKVSAKIEQFFVGLDGATDKVLLLQGVAIGPLRWAENERTIEIDIIDLATEWDEPIGFLATRDDFPEIAAEDEGRMLPIIYGEGVKRVKAVAVDIGKKGRLLRACGIDDTTLYIEGFEELPAGRGVSARIGDEILSGNIYGTEWRTVTRGLSRYSGRTTASQLSTEKQSIITNLEGYDGQYVGLWLKVNVPNTAAGPAGTALVGSPSIGGANSTYQYKRITQFESATGRLSWEGGSFFKIAGGASGSYFGALSFAVGNEYLLPKQKQFDIVSLASAHSAGEEVVEYRAQGVWYIVADHPVQRIRGVYVKGAASSTPGLDEAGVNTGASQINALAGAQTGGQGANQATPEAEASAPSRESWRVLSSLDYKVQYVDTDLLGVGHPVTALRLPAPPTLNRSLAAQSDELWVDVDGAYVDSTLIQNPIAVLEDIIEEYGPGASKVDTTISGATIRGRVAQLRCRFALTEQTPFIELCARLAFIARCRFYLTDVGRAAVQYLTLFGDAKQADVGDSKIALDSFVLGWRDFDTIATRVAFAFTTRGEVRHGQLDDAAQQATYGVRKVDVDLSWLANEGMARWIAQFWLDRRKRLNRTADFSTGLQTLELQVGDQIDLARTGIHDTSPAAIQAVGHAFGEGAAERPDLLGYRTQLPLWEGCATNCEAECQTGCESQCEVYCQLTCQTGCEEACQTSCQAICQITCETATELSCADGCQTGCTLGCEWTCTGSNTVTTYSCAVGACETDCMAGCEICCVTGCTVPCQLECQTCETACEGACPCQIDCQTSCVLTCQTTCEFACQLACEATGCESEEVCDICCMVSPTALVP